jgi:hypothetical protein
MHQDELDAAWVCLTQHLPLSRFLTFPGVCFSQNFATLFHVAAAHRVHFAENHSLSSSEDISALSLPPQNDRANVVLSQW